MSTHDTTAKRTLTKGAVLSFEGGSLHIHQSGPRAEPGSGYFIFDENDVQWVAHDEKEGCYLEVKVARSEMIELRNWLNEVVG
jgi:hypothetical protein